jgi:hypothetical protein
VAFNDVLDALVVVDLPRAPEALLRRYMGREAARAYRAHHLRRGACVPRPESELVF